MRGIFDEEELPPVEQRRTTELTLSPTILLGLFFVLLMFCGLCFGVGYTMGSRESQKSPVTDQKPGAGTSVQVAGSLPKPSAIQKDISPPPAAATAPTPAPAQPAPVLPASTTNPEPGVGTAQVVMVQIATVSRQEDADILINALSKHGYTATARRDAADNKLHVQIGPFSNRNDANAMSKKLLHDGYNAIVQP